MQAPYAWAAVVVGATTGAASASVNAFEVAGSPVLGITITVVATGLVALVGAVIGSKITTAVLRTELKHLRDEHRRAERQIERLYEKIDSHLTGRDGVSGCPPHDRRG